MPIYEFTCRSCRREFEELVPKLDGVAPCPDCGSVDVARRPSQFAFRGTGRPGAAGASSCTGCKAGTSACATCRG